MRRVFRITHWAFLTVFLYAATLLVLWWPLFISAFCYWGTDPLTVDPSDMRGFYTEPGTWVALSVLAVLQGVFLLVPLQIERGRPISRRRWGLLAALAALMLGLLTAALIYSVGEAVIQNAFFGSLWSSDPMEQLCSLLPLSAGLVIWIAWGWLFWRYARLPLDDTSRLNRVVRWLLAGSAAELLVAVPCHVYVRHKEHCCAGFNTFIGIAVGLAVMLFAFGPGVFFLFVRRTRELRKAQEATATTTAPRPTRWGGRARDGRMWCVVGLLFLLLCRAGFWLGSTDAAEMAAMGQMAFLVLWCAAIRDVWRGAHEEEDGAFEAGLIVLACFPLVVWIVCALVSA